MAGESPVKGLCEETTCPLCLDFFTDPVAIDCGHNFCQACLTQCWGASQEEVSCPQCRETIQQKAFKPNRQLANIAELVKKLQEGKKRESEREGKRDACKIHQDPLKLFCREDETPICVVCDRAKHRRHMVLPLEEAFQEYKTQLELEKMKIKSLFERMQRFLEEKQHLCLAQLEDLEKEMGKRQEKTLTKLSEEISQLGLLITEMEEKCLQPACEFLQDIRNSLVRCEKSLVGHVVDVCGNLEERLTITSQKTSALQKVTELYKVSLSQAPKTESPNQAPKRVNVTLDRETAHPRFLLSQNLKNVRILESAQQVPDNPERFDQELFVLGHERFTSGRHCWEAEMYKAKWAVGISRETVRRKGNIALSPEEGIWAVGRSGNSEISVFTIPLKTSVYLRTPPSKIYVALDYEKGCVEFFEAYTKEFIFAFHSLSFSGEGIRPFFYVSDYGTLKC
ncbi:zinc finger protein RFP-like isoform X2 [Sceloporus undulatus]|uniref:zinc finger protein RFP-like isoform X2 n=1 Tax=Sceloporus undulatus TaxID=8520 RepID=UPI001C4C962B|nr:zinc finger protein RFP-like isoform X2 [Sceloporus undulatus]